jgi:hypothetical protein
MLSVWDESQKKVCVLMDKRNACWWNENILSSNIGCDVRYFHRHRWKDAWIPWDFANILKGKKKIRVEEVRSISFCIKASKFKFKSGCFVI